MKAFEKLMISIRLEPEIYKKLKHICIDKDLSVQEFVAFIIKEEIEKNRA